jgi:tryptophan synthase beta chain
MVRDFQSIIGQEARQQMLDTTGKLPNVVLACVGGGSNAIGIFYPFLSDSSVQLVGVEAGGRGSTLGEHAARFLAPRPGVLQGTYSYVLQDEYGQIALTHSVSAGLDYASIGPEHAWLHDTGRASYTFANDDEALDAFQRLSQLEGIIPALESAHAIAEALKLAPTMQPDQSILINLSGRGDKDIFTVADVLGVEI